MTTQLHALSGRALRDVARDPYLATLHVVMTPLVGLFVGNLFGDLRRDNSETAGIQVGAAWRRTGWLSAVFGRCCDVQQCWWSV